MLCIFFYFFLAEIFFLSVCPGSTDVNELKANSSTAKRLYSDPVK